MTRVRRSRTSEEIEDEEKRSQKFEDRSVRRVSGVLLYRVDTKDVYRAASYRWYFVGRAGVAFVKVLEDGTFKLHVNGRVGEELEPFASEDKLHAYLVKEIET